MEQYLGRLDWLAREAVRGGSDPDPLCRLHRLRAFLFEEVGFRGNVEEYYDPHNSLLNVVLERKLGIPITLSLVMMEVGRRLDLEIQGIGLPAHFIVRAELDSCQVLLDPFNGGTILTLEGAQELVSRVLGRRLALQDEHFVAVTKRQLLARLLQNLKAIHCRQEAWSKALQIVQRLLALKPDSHEEIRDRGAILTGLGEHQRAIADWERYLELYPEAPDAETVRVQLRQLRQTLAALN